MSWRDLIRYGALAGDLEQAHGRAVRAATAGVQDAALGTVRLSGPDVPEIAEAAVSSATPFLRAPLLARISRVRMLHPDRPASGLCPTCGVDAPCTTAKELL